MKNDAPAFQPNNLTAWRHIQLYIKSYKFGVIDLPAFYMDFEGYQKNRFKNRAFANPAANLNTAPIETQVTKKTTELPDPKLFFSEDESTSSSSISFERFLSSHSTHLMESP